MLDKAVGHTLDKTTLTLRQKVGQLFMPAAFINDTEEEVQNLEKLIRDHHIGAICFFHSRASAATNFEGKKKIVHNEKSYDRLKQLITRYQKAAKFPLLVAMDAEWGLAMRIENTPQYPYAITLGAMDDGEDLIYSVGYQIGKDCRQAGIHWNLAPVVDINNNPENPVIGYRSFGDDKKSVLHRSKAYIDGMGRAGVLNAIKHFPGHGDTAMDSHLGLPVINKSLEELKENELFPFQELIKKGVDAVMVGHLSLPQLDSHEPSTTSSIIITDLLRKTMGFGGVIISDALNMHAVSKKYTEQGGLELAAFTAGMDMLCFSEHAVEGIESILGSASKERINESFERIWHLKEKIFFRELPEESVQHDPKNLNRQLAQHSLTELYGNPSDVKKIKESNFLNLSWNAKVENIFSKRLHEEYGMEAIDLMTAHDAFKDKIATSKNLVLALFPPAVKPKNLFGFEAEQLKRIKDLIVAKNVLIYLFGNPYAIDILGLGPTSNIVLIYQDFPEFQEEALRHFKGLLTAKGRLPVQLKTFKA